MTTTQLEYDVYRQCRACGQWKTLEHFYIYGGDHITIVDSKKVCAGCRIFGRQPA